MQPKEYLWEVFFTDGPSEYHRTSGISESEATERLKFKLNSRVAKILSISLLKERTNESA